MDITSCVLIDTLSGVAIDTLSGVAIDTLRCSNWYIKWWIDWYIKWAEFQWLKKSQIATLGDHLIAAHERSYSRSIGLEMFATQWSLQTWCLRRFLYLRIAKYLNEAE